MFFKKTKLALLHAATLGTALSTPVFSQQQPVSIEVNLAKVKAPMQPIWAFFG